MEKSNNLTQFMKKYGVSLEDYDSNFGGLVGEFKIPPTIIAYNSNLANDKEQVFNLLAYSIFNTINAIVNNKLLSYQQDTFENWSLLVGSLRAENLKLAIYEEIKYRSLSNYFPELENRQVILPSGVNLTSTANDNSSVNSLVNSVSAELISNSKWEELPDKKDDYYRNLLNRFAKPDLSNILVDLSHADKYLKIKDDGRLVYDSGTGGVSWGSITGNFEDQEDLVKVLKYLEKNTLSNGEWIHDFENLKLPDIKNDLTNAKTDIITANNNISDLTAKFENLSGVKKFNFILPASKVRAHFTNPFPKQNGFYGSSDWYMQPGYAYVSFTDWRNNFGFNDAQRAEFQKAMGNAIGAFLYPGDSNGANLFHQIENIRFSDNGNDLELTFWPRTSGWATNINNIKFKIYIYYLNEKVIPNEVPQSATGNTIPTTPPANNTPNQNPPPFVDNGFNMVLK